MADLCLASHCAGYMVFKGTLDKHPTVKRIYDRCMADDRFFDIFYDRFVASSPAVADRFRHTDDRRQKKAVRASLYLIMSCAARTEPDYAMLEPLAQRHSRRQLDIGPELYRLWLDSLIESVRTCDPRFDPTIERVWRDAMQHAIDFLVSRY